MDINNPWASCSTSETASALFKSRLPFSTSKQTLEILGLSRSKPGLDGWVPRNADTVQSRINRFLTKDNQYHELKDTLLYIHNNPNLWHIISPSNFFFKITCNILLCLAYDYDWPVLQIKAFALLPVCGRRYGVHTEISGCGVLWVEFWYKAPILHLYETFARNSWEAASMVSWCLFQYKI